MITVQQSGEDTVITERLGEVQTNFEQMQSEKVTQH